MRQLRLSMLSLAFCAAGNSYAQKHAEEFILSLASVGPGVSASLPAELGVSWTGSVAWPEADHVAVNIENLVLADGDVLLLSDPAGARVETITGPLSQDSHWSLPFPSNTVLIDVIGDGGSTFSINEAKIVFSRADRAEAVKAGVDSIYAQLRGPATEAPKRGDVGSVDTKVIYGEDHRREVYEVTDPRMLLVAQATASLIQKTKLATNPNGTYTLSSSPWTQAGGGTLCADEPYRDQPVPGFCTGFLVSQDLLLTAGHCINSSNSHTIAFVFGHKMQGPGQDPSSTLQDADVYFAAELVDRVMSGAQDHALVRLDRPVVARAPLSIRREGEVALNTPLFVVGHPAGLPMKIAAGAKVTNPLSGVDFFQANLDTFGGNSGSPVVNGTTFMVEGILVRGAPDYRTRAGETCIESNRVPDTGNTASGLRFEEVSKLTPVLDKIPELVGSEGSIKLDKALYRHNDTMAITVRDVDIRAAERVNVMVTSDRGLNFSALLIEDVPPTGIFRGVLQLSAFPLAHGEVITITYLDADNGFGEEVLVHATATVDMEAPQIFEIATDSISGTNAVVTLKTSEPAFVEINLATSCGGTVTAVVGGVGDSHSILLRDLQPLTTYHFTVSATDLAGHNTVENNQNACYVFRTRELADHFTEAFSAGKKNELVGQTITFAPANISSFYAVCRVPAGQLPTNPDGGNILTMLDDDSIAVALSQSIELYRVAYDTIYVGSNGYITFAGPDMEWEAKEEFHFARPRVAPFFNDFDPTKGGTVSWKETSDRVAITWQSVPLFSTQPDPPQATFQAELFFDGRIALTNLNSAELYSGIVGLSRGLGRPADHLIGSDLNSYPACIPSASIGHYDFTEGNDGWSFVSIDGLFSAPEAYTTAKGFGFETLNNVDTVGIWHVADIQGSTQANRLYKARFHISSNQSDARRVPTFRLRTSGDQYEESHVLNVSSSQEASYSPSLNGYEYTHYFTMAAGDKMRVAFDIISNDPADAEVAQLLMESLVIESFNVADLMDEREELTVNPADAPTWTTEDARVVLDVPTFTRAAQGLAIKGPAQPAVRPVFGYWTSPPVDDMLLQEDRVYRIEYTVASNAPAAQRTKVPSFRLRINDESLMSSAYVHVESTNMAMHVPTVGAPKTYGLFYLAPPAFTGKRIIFAFDYLWTPDSGDDQSYELTLTNLQVRSYRQPL